MKKWGCFLMLIGLMVLLGACASFPHKIPPEPRNGGPSSPAFLPEGTGRFQVPRESKKKPSRPLCQPCQFASARLVALGKKNIQLGNYDRGITLLERSLSLDGYNAHAYYYLAMAWFKKGDFDRALTFSKKTEIFFGRDRQTLKKVFALEGRIYQRMGQPKEARRCRRKGAQTP